MIGVVIQARMGSKRLPGKVLKPIGKIPLLERIVLCLEYLKSNVQVVVATSNQRQDDAIEVFCRERQIEFFRGDEQNVLQRYVDCMHEYGFEHVVRLTGDNPFTDIEELDRLIELHVARAADYSTSTASLPIGVGAEIFSALALLRIHEQASKPHHYEHVNEVLLENPGQFSIAELEVPPAKNRPDVRLTVDTPDDYRRADCIARSSPSIPLALEEAISLAPGCSS